MRVEGRGSWSEVSLLRWSAKRFAKRFKTVRFKKPPEPQTLIPKPQTPDPKPRKKLQEEEEGAQGTGQIQRAREGKW